MHRQRSEHRPRVVGHVVRGAEHTIGSAIRDKEPIAAGKQSGFDHLSDSHAGAADLSEVALEQGMHSEAGISARS